MKKLYEVQATTYVMAENEFEAVDVLNDFETEIDIADCEVFEAGSIPRRWTDAIPWGGDDDKTCGEIIGSRNRINARIQTI